MVARETPAAARATICSIPSPALAAKRAEMMQFDSLLSWYYMD
jgi:hypothetical protein